MVHSVCGVVGCNIVLYFNEAIIGIIFYTNKFIPKGSAACARTIFIFIRPEYKDDAQVPVDDVRFKAGITNGSLVISAKFEVSGNYRITAKRLNEGLDRIGAGIHLTFDTLEFDVYV